MNMSRFLRFPASIAIEQAQKLKSGADVPALKVMLGAAIAKGLFDERIGGLDTDGAFPASTSALQDYSCLGRAKTLSAMQKLLAAGILQLAENQPAEDIDPRTRWFKFVGSIERFAAFPYGHWRDTNAMEGFREGSSITSAALRLYLLLASHRQKTSGVSWLTYKRASELGVGQNVIRPAYGRLQALELLVVGPANQDNEANRYVVLGLDARPTRLSATRWQQDQPSYSR